MLLLVRINSHGRNVVYGILASFVSLRMSGAMVSFISFDLGPLPVKDCCYLLAEAIDRLPDTHL